MPTISEFYGILIKMYFDDHAPAHFHAFYGEHEALIDIRSLEMIRHLQINPILLNRLFRFWAQ